MRRLGLVLSFLLAARTFAQEGGVQDPPPGPEEDVGPPKIQTDDDGRFAVRGRPIDRREEKKEREELRAFEREAFAPDALREPDFVDRPDLVGKDQLPEALRGAQHARGATARPEELRPDLPWLAGLKLGDIPVRWDPRVIAYLEFYRSDPRGRAIMGGWLKAQGRYRDMILEALRRHHLPEDLLYVCMIESSYDPLDYSRAGASGLWQFMPANSRIYGLEINRWVDERNDPEKSNEAQMYYFQDLIDRFGTWHLALAAFNAGYGAVLRSLAKYGTNDFWALLDLEGGLPWESSVYVPKLIAAAIVGRNREGFGYAGVVPDPPWEFDRVVVPKSVDLSTVARAAGVTVAEIKALNPALRRNRTPPGVADFPLRIPKGTRERFAQAFPQLRGDWDGYDAYVMRWGERFEDVARTYGVSPARLRELNGVKDPTEIRGGVTIVVPHVDEETRARNRKLAENDLYRSGVEPSEDGDALLVAVKDKDATVPGKKRVFYRVVAGDTLEDVAAAFGVAPGDIAEWNGLDIETKIQARMVLAVFVDPKFDADKRHIALLDDSRLYVVTRGSPEHLDMFEGRKGRKRVELVAKEGDTLESIGKKYGLTKYDVARINRRSYVTPLEAGEPLVVYQVVDKVKAKKAGVLKPAKAAARKDGKKKPARK
ncbi:MAG TPA: LysM peptidoglycan-binding domain-containing protein [Haliangiales bacterium]|nr:LysM peptidoglycan-binding domain-containing protein [Haliangiales bacterium]